MVQYRGGGGGGGGGGMDARKQLDTGKRAASDSTM